MFILGWLKQTFQLFACKNFKSQCFLSIPQRRDCNGQLFHKKFIIEVMYLLSPLLHFHTMWVIPKVFRG